MRKFILSFALSAMTLANMFAAPNPNRRELGEGYIQQYHEIAVLESLRTGIPASIKLAQGLLESNFGQGRLALMSNNHFGIKWRSPSDGDYVEAYDDEKDRRGRQISSRFVKFSSPEESYRQHSDLLVTRSIYRLLFTYDRSDYRSWALGLKKAGYATDPQYANKLIQIVEQYHLDRFDIPTQLSFDDTPQYPQPSKSEFSEDYKLYQQAPNSDNPSLPTRKMKVTKTTTEAKTKREEVEQSVVNHTNEQPTEEEHILFEVTPEMTSKSIHNPVPKRQKK